jgi:hypothetical protein
LAFEEPLVTALAFWPLHCVFGFLFWGLLASFFFFVWVVDAVAPLDQFFGTGGFFVYV